MCRRRTAAPVTPQEALERAGTGAPQSMRAMNLRQATLARTMTSAKGTPTLYLFNTPGGFAVMPADNCAYPVLGYGNTAVPEGELPANLQAWLDDYSAQIEYAVSHNAGASMPDKAPYERPQWDAIAPLCATTWNQSEPYNNDCPTVSGQKSPTGCVATAMAQVMKYHNYPAAGTGSITYTDAQYGYSYSMTLGTLDWNNMLDRYNSGEYTDAEAAAVAFLMKSCGYSVEMMYGPYSSGAYVNDVPDALVKYFDYDVATHFVDRTYYPLSEWEQMAYDNLRDVGPILFRGQGDGGGHAFVCDGYLSDGYFHFNWGWGGTSDGYFLLTACNPGDLGIGGGTGGGFNSYQGMVLGIRPPVAGSVRFTNPLVVNDDVTATISGKNITLAGGFYNSANTFAITAALALIVEGEDGQTYTSVDREKYNIERYYGFRNYTMTLPELADGTYKVYPACVIGDETEVRRMLCPISAVGYCILTVNNGAYSVSSPAVQYSLALSDYEALSPFFVGREFAFTSIITNTGDSEVLTDIGTRLTAVASSSTVLATGPTVAIDLLPGQDIKLAFEGSWTWENGVTETAGNYNLEIYDTTRETVLYRTTISLQADPGSPTLSASAFSIVPQNGAIDAVDMHYTATVKCESGYFFGNLVVAIFNSEGNQNMHQFNVPELLSLSAGESKTIDFTDQFTDGVAGTQYIAALFYIKDNSYKQIGFTYFTPTDQTTGVEGISASGTDADVTYYDLQGNKVTAPQPGNIYIRVADGKPAKVMM